MIRDIIDGHIKELFDQNNKLFKDRMDVCKKCPLYISTISGPICNSKLWINKDNVTSKTKTDGFVRGCGCRLNAKTRVEKGRCIILKW